MTHRALVLVFLPLLIAGAAVEAGEDDVKPAPEVLVARWLAATPKERPALEARIRARGPACLAALRAVGPKATPVQRAGAGRMRAWIRADWARRHVPDGMIYVPAGPLEVPRKTSPWGPSGTRRVVGAFYIDRTEVTVRAWRAWRKKLSERDEQGARDARRLWKPPADMPGDLPAVRVRWAEAKRYAAEARGGRLPTADEFERALRGSGLATWPWGPAFRADHANLRGFGPEKPEAVGLHLAGASTFGALDLVGNVAEWSATTVSQGTRGEYPLVLGGSFRDSPSSALTWRGLGRMRARTGPRERTDWLGFRVVRDVPPIPE